MYNADWVAHKRLSSHIECYQKLTGSLSGGIPGGGGEHQAVCPYYPYHLPRHGVLHAQYLCREGTRHASAAQRGSRVFRPPRQAAPPRYRRGRCEGDRSSLGSAYGQEGKIPKGLRCPGIPGCNARQEARAAPFFVANLDNIQTGKMYK
jgi:hypothetical protein